ncbi:MAG: TrkH family potassium uptake protein [Tissierellia bacterium]|nr:TrkH family potassium uptake protein [Tissierellia bacterium]
MNRKIVSYVLGRTLIIEALLMFIPLLVSFIYKESLEDKMNFVISIGLCLFLGFILSINGDQTGKFFTREALLIVALGWIFISIMGAIPLYLTKNDYFTFVDSLFEMISGFTTTGASVAHSVENLPHSILFWRSFSHFIGGMGILVFTLAVLPKTNKQSSLIMKAEVPGPTFGKLVSKLSETARLLYKIYIVLTFILIAFLIFGKVGIFDSFILGFGAAGTGGFASKDLSVGFYESRYTEVVLTVGMLVFGVNFNLYYYALIRNAREAFKSEELKVYLAIVIVSSIAIFFNIKGMYNSLGYSLINSFFTVSSIITTTGYVSADYGKWPLFSQAILFMLMFVGGCAGSTAGGLKVSRIIIMFKTAINEVKNIVNPNRVTVTTIDHKPIGESVERKTANYILVYILLFTFTLILICADTSDFQSAFVAVSTAINNIGPGSGDYGPIANFQSLHQFSKIILMIAMLLGRLEIFPILILFAPNTWKKKKFDIRQ